MESSLRITEIFYSLQGESSSVGFPTVFVRLTGCPLRCSYCDTAYAFHGGEKKPVQEIISEIKKYQCQYICVTGGEPLAQPNVLTLMKMLCDLGFYVSVETSGARPIEHIDQRVRIVMDLKTPKSGEVDKNLFDNLNWLKKTDEIKFVIGDKNDYQWSRDIIQQYKLEQKCPILFSPSYQELEAKQLAEWILTDRLPVRFQLQLHKLLWNDEPGH